MSDQADPRVQDLMERFNKTFDKIMGEGRKHGPDANTKIIAHVVAIRREDCRILGCIDRGGAVAEFAMVNGKGYVEPRGQDDAGLEKALIKHADHIARTVPCRPDEASMHCYSARPHAKVFG